MNKFLMWIFKYLAATYATILGLSLRYNQRTKVPHKKVIFAFWHRDMLSLMYLHRKYKIVLLISSSKDGELITGPARLMGYQTARGSSRRGGAAASRKIIKLAKNNYIGITPDGPKGPNMQIKEGIIYLSYLTKLPIVPVAADIKWEKTLKSWDKFRLPFLFSKVNVTYGDPIIVNSKDNFPQKQAELQQAMDDLSKENKFK